MPAAPDGPSLSDTSPGPPPLGVAVVDKSLVVFGRIFPRVAQKHRMQMLQHFGECIRTAKTNKAEILQINIFTALLSGLKGLVEEKTVFGGSEVISAATSLITAALTSQNPLLRCAAGEALGRMAQVVMIVMMIMMMMIILMTMIRSCKTTSLSPRWRRVLLTSSSRPVTWLAGRDTR